MQAKVGKDADGAKAQISTCAFGVQRAGVKGGGQEAVAGEELKDVVQGGGGCSVGEPQVLCYLGGREHAAGLAVLGEYVGHLQLHRRFESNGQAAESRHLHHFQPGFVFAAVSALAISRAVTWWQHWANKHTDPLTHTTKFQWDIFVSDFKQRFLPPEYLTALEDEFAELKQKGIPVLSYSNKLLTLAQQIGSTEEEKLRAFSRGLDASIKYSIRNLKPATYEEALALSPNKELELNNATYEQHLLDVERVLQILEDNQFYVNSKKTTFGVQEVFYLGFIISSDGIRLDPEKITAISSWKIPQTAQQIRFFVGLCQAYSRHMKNFLKIELRLPPSWTMHNVFHVSWLKPYVGPPLEDVTDEQQPEVLDEAEVIELEQILLHRWKHGSEEGRDSSSPNSVIEERMKQFG
ncbi:hypothetical protein L7F22_002925 [Adiantum nelumboides]|nr:hypothetical protein [Adiantum nelumboides]